MVVGGPNARKDYHYNETEELFYQLEGEITVKTQQNGERVDVKMGPGDMFLLPPKVPHSPVRTDGSIGLVIERVRVGKGFTDGLLWFCENCNHKLHEAYFELKISKRISCIISTTIMHRKISKRVKIVAKCCRNPNSN